MINGTAGAVIAAGSRVLSIMAFIVAHGRIVEIDVLQDPERLIALDLAVLGPIAR